MDDYRQAGGGGDLQLAAKCALLFLETRCRSRKIEPGFADGNRAEILDRSLQLASRAELS